jgi:hypothetical protein
MLASWEEGEANGAAAPATFIHLPVQDVAGDKANPLFDTNKSDLSAPDSPGAYGVLPLPSRDAVSQQASVMSASARQVRLHHFSLSHGAIMKLRPSHVLLSCPSLPFLHQDSPLML